MAHSAICQAPKRGPDGNPRADQAQPIPAKEEPSAGIQSVFVPADRTTLLQLSDARQLLQQERYAEAVRLLGSILENPEDYFYQPDQSSAVHQSLKAQAQRMLGAMPRQGRELYELQYGARARQMLGEAVKTGSVADVSEVTRRFFHTQAGYEATLLLGLDYLDHGSPLAGALTLRRLQEEAADSAQFEPALSLAMATCWLRAGMPQQARQVLGQLKERHPQAKVQVAGQDAPPLAEQADSLDWLVALIGRQPSGESSEAEQWAMFRGNAARNASGTGNGPLLSMRWQVPTYEHPYVQGLIEQIEESHRLQEPNDESLPGLHPLVVNDVVLMRSVRNLLAVDFSTGKRIWEVPTDDPFASASRLTSETSRRDSGIAADRFGQQANDFEALQLRLWSDATYGTLSSDGQLVFAIEDLGLLTSDIAPRLEMNGSNASRSSPASYNRLAAYDIRTGKLKWNLGGSPTESDLHEPGVFFLGPPLPLMGELYVLGESKGEIRLMALGAKSGEVLWTQQLCVVDRDILNDPMRRLAGASPSYADGVLVCPTANRSVVAMELATRSLLWGYSYSEDSQVGQRQMVFGMRAVLSSDQTGRWSDTTATIADGRVLVTPPDSNQIHCLSLLDGKLLWSQPRQNDLYLACVHQGVVVFVGREHVRGLRLEDGKPAWDGQITSLPNDSATSGRGFVSGDHYYLPLSSAEVVAIALDTGRIVHTFKARSGTVPGNLICYHGHVVSQRADAVEVFYQLDALREEIDRRLGGNPNDAEALALRGQIQWDAGQLEQAIQSLRGSWELTQDPRTRELLRDALLEGLRTDFPAYRQHEEEIVGLVDQPSQRATYLRLMAGGCEAAGELDAALDYYLKLVDLDRQHRAMEVLDKSLVVRRDRWLRMQLATLREKAPPPTQTRVDEAGRTRLAEAVKAGSSDALRQYLEYFGDLPIAAEGERHLLDRLKKDGRMLEAELWLTQQQQSPDRSIAAAATAELAQLLQDAGRTQDAAVCYARLKADFADVICRDGKTGSQLIDGLAADDPARRLLEPADVWPKGKVSVDTAARSTTPPQLAYTRSVLEYSGSPAPFFSDLDIEMHQNPPKLVARDGLGQQRWELSSSDLVDQGNFMAGPAFTRVVVQGHLLLLSLGQKIVAIDTLATDKAGSPRVVWSRDFEEEAGGAADSPVTVRLQAAPGFAGAQRFQMVHSPDGSFGTAMAVSEQVLCYQRSRELTAIEPSTGATLWVRRGLEPGSVVFGDCQYVFVAAPEQNTATVLRATDGSLVGTRPLPAQRVATLGRLVLAVQDEPNARVLRLIDPLDSREIWPATRFAAETKLCLVDHEAVGALEPDGRFRLTRLADGQAIIDAKLPRKAAVEEIHVLQSPDGYTLVTNSGEREDGAVPRTQPLQAASSARIVRGWVWGFDRSGGMLWPEPILVQNQQLPLNQPRRLPVLLFACTLQERRPNAPIQQKTSLLFLDKRTGWHHAQNLAFATPLFQLAGTPDQKTVQMQLPRSDITLTFTDQPLEPQQPAPGAGGPGGTAKAIWKALGRGALKALSEPLESLSPEAIERAAEEAGQGRQELPGTQEEPAKQEE